MRRFIIGVVLAAALVPGARVQAGHGTWVCSATPSVLIQSDRCHLHVACPPGPFTCRWSARVEAEGIGLVHARLETGWGAPRAECAFPLGCVDQRPFTSLPGETDVFECSVSGIALQVRLACSVGVAGHD